MGDLDAAVAYAKASGKADTSRLGITGFCWGGRKTVWMYAAHNPGHGFNADYRPSYRKEAAEDGWKRLRSWFAVYGVV